MAAPARLEVRRSLRRPPCHLHVGAHAPHVRHARGRRVEEMLERCGRLPGDDRRARREDRRGGWQHQLVDDRAADRGRRRHRRPACSCPMASAATTRCSRPCSRRSPARCSPRAPPRSSRILRYLGIVNVLVRLARSASPYYTLNITDRSIPLTAVIERRTSSTPRRPEARWSTCRATWIRRARS